MAFNYTRYYIINRNIKVLFISALEAADEILSMFPEIDSSGITESLFREVISSIK